MVKNAEKEKEQPKKEKKVLEEDKEEDKIKRELVKQLEIMRQLRGVEKPQDRKRQWDYIYLIKCNEFYKIGRTANLDKRFEIFQIGCPYPLLIYFAGKVPNAIESEEYLHYIFEKKRVRGEWFKLDDSDLLKAIRYILLAEELEKNYEAYKKNKQ